jgi:hypothetical protein
MLGHGVSSVFPGLSLGLSSEAGASIAPQRQMVNQFAGNGSTQFERLASERSGRLRYLGAERTVDDDGSQHDIMQQPAAAVEQPDQ